MRIRLNFALVVSGCLGVSFGHLKQSFPVKKHYYEGAAKSALSNILSHCILSHLAMAYNVVRVKLASLNH